MYKLLPLFTALLLTACDPCDCDDCCVDSAIDEFQNATAMDLELRWFKPRLFAISDPSDTIIMDVVPVSAGETVLLSGFIAPGFIGDLSCQAFSPGGERSSYDSVSVFDGTSLIETFYADGDCTRNPLCKSAYNRSERQLENSTETTFLYVYE